MPQGSPRLNLWTPRGPTSYKEVSRGLFRNTCELPLCPQAGHKWGGKPGLTSSLISHGEMGGISQGKMSKVQGTQPEDKAPATSRLRKLADMPLPIDPDAHWSFSILSSLTYQTGINGSVTDLAIAGEGAVSVKLARQVEGM